MKLDQKKNLLNLSSFPLDKTGDSEFDLSNYINHTAPESVQKNFDLFLITPRIQKACKFIRNENIQLTLIEKCFHFWHELMNSISLCIFLICGKLIRSLRLYCVRRFLLLRWSFSKVLMRILQKFPFPLRSDINFLIYFTTCTVCC